MQGIAGQARNDNIGARNDRIHVCHCGLDPQSHSRPQSPHHNKQKKRQAFLFECLALDIIYYGKWIWALIK
jgi:hypothetical protein